MTERIKILHYYVNITANQLNFGTHYFRNVRKRNIQTFSSCTIIPIEDDMFCCTGKKKKNEFLYYLFFSKKFHVTFFFHTSRSDNANRGSSTVRARHEKRHRIVRRVLLSAFVRLPVYSVLQR